MKGYQKFLNQFQFDSEKTLMVGVERECFLANKEGQIIPIAHQVLEYLNGNRQGRFGYELSACQLEDRTDPLQIENLRNDLEKNERILVCAEENLGFKRLQTEVGPADMPLDVYPDPRYQEMTANWPQEKLLAACRVIGTHVHVGMPSHKTALKTYNRLTENDNCERLCQMGDGSQGKRLEIYKITAPNFQPTHHKNWLEFFHYATANNFEEDPRSCWHLIRISIHGTIEFRMFGATDDLRKIENWARKCHELCREALNF